MLRLGLRMKMGQAHELGIVDDVAGSNRELIAVAAERVGELEGAVAGPGDAPVVVEVPPVEARGPGGNVLSEQVVGIIGQAITDAAAATSLNEALEIGYRAFGASACTAAAAEGIGAFLGRRRADFGKTG
jgi:enoyl-CoA hydratase/3-hydroxyacyl-CoA dehydrogenase